MADFRKRQSGSALILATLSLVLLCGIVGLAVDAGWGYFRKQAEQNAAEAAALAAMKYAQAQGFACGASVVCGGGPQPCPYPVGPPTSNVQAGCYYATLNGFNANPPQNVVLTANIGTLSGGTDPTVLNVANGQPYYTVPTYYWVTAQVVESIPQLFSAVLGNTTMLTSARATAAFVPIAMNSCGYILGSAGTVLTLNGGTINAPDCNLYVNGSVVYPPNALNIGQLDIQASATCDGQVLTCPFGVNPVFSLLPPANDPFVALNPPPPQGGCLPPLTINGTQTVPPGNYCGGITITGGNVTFSSGTYYIGGAGLNVAGGALSGAGVSFINTPGASAFNIQSGVTGTLSAPTTGPLQGMLFFDRNLQGVPGEQFLSTSLNLTGDLYSPNAAVTTNFNPGSEILIVAQTLTASGGTMTQPALGTPGGPTAQVVTLIE